MALVYPDLVLPAGWRALRGAMQVRFVPTAPPGDRAAAIAQEAVIIVSPLVPRTPANGTPAEVVERAILADTHLRFEVEAQKGPVRDKTETGLEGVLYEVTGHARPLLGKERRTYACYADQTCLYSVSLMATPAGHDAYGKTFLAAARSIRPYQGRVRPVDTGSLARVFEPFRD